MSDASMNLDVFEGGGFEGGLDSLLEVGDHFRREEEKRKPRAGGRPRSIKAEPNMSELGTSSSQKNGRKSRVKKETQFRTWSMQRINELKNMVRIGNISSKNHTKVPPELLMVPLEPISSIGHVKGLRLPSAASYQNSKDNSDPRLINPAVDLAVAAAASSSSSGSASASVSASVLDTGFGSRSRPETAVAGGGAFAGDARYGDDDAISLQLGEPAVNDESCVFDSSGDHSHSLIAAGNYLVHSPSPSSHSGGSAPGSGIEVCAGVGIGSFNPSELLASYSSGAAAAAAAPGDLHVSNEHSKTRGVRAASKGVAKAVASDMSYVPYLGKKDTTRKPDRMPAGDGGSHEGDAVPTQVVDADGKVRNLAFPLQGAIVKLKTGKYAGYHGRVMCKNQRFDTGKNVAYHVQIVGTKVKTTMSAHGFDVIQGAQQGSAGYRGAKADMSQKGAYVMITSGDYNGCVAIVLSKAVSSGVVRLRVAPFQVESEDKTFTNAYHRVRLVEGKFRTATQLEVQMYEEASLRREAAYHEAVARQEAAMLKKALQGEQVPRVVVEVEGDARKVPGGKNWEEVALAERVIGPAPALNSAATMGAGKSAINHVRSNRGITTNNRSKMWTAVKSAGIAMAAARFPTASGSTLTADTAPDDVYDPLLTAVAVRANGADWQRALDANALDSSLIGNVMGMSGDGASDRPPGWLGLDGFIEQHDTGVPRKRGPKPGFRKIKQDIAASAAAASGFSVDGGDVASARGNTRGSSVGGRSMSSGILSLSSSGTGSKPKRARLYKHPNSSAALEMERLATVSILLGIGPDDLPSPFSATNRSGVFFGAAPAGEAGETSTGLAGASLGLIAGATSFAPCNATFEANSLLASGVSNVAAGAGAGANAWDEQGALLEVQSTRFEAAVARSSRSRKRERGFSLSGDELYEQAFDTGQSDFVTLHADEAVVSSGRSIGVAAGMGLTSTMPSNMVAGGSTASSLGAVAAGGLAIVARAGAGAGLAGAALNQEQMAKLVLLNSAKCAQEKQLAQARMANSALAAEGQGMPLPIGGLVSHKKTYKATKPTKPQRPPTYCEASWKKMKKGQRISLVRNYSRRRDKEIETSSFAVSAEGGAITGIAGGAKYQSSGPVCGLSMLSDNTGELHASLGFAEKEARGALALSHS